MASVTRLAAARALRALTVLLVALAANAPAAMAQTEVPRDWALNPTGIGIGDSFRLLIVTSTRQKAESSTIGAYDTVVQNDVSSNGHTAIKSYSANFKVLGCTSTTDATTHTSTGSSDTAAPIYWLNGAKVADDYADFYDDSWDSNVPKYPDGTNAPTVGVLDPYTWVGCRFTGLRSNYPLGSAAGVSRGLAGTAGSELLVHDEFPFSRVSNFRYYGLSGIFKVVTNPAPVFSDERLTRSVAENSAAGTNVGDPIPTATDANGDTLTYSMEGADAGSFDFDASARQIKTKTGVTYDHEAKSSYSVTIKADDANGGTGTIAVTISVTDVKERPAAPAAPSVAATSGTTTSLDVSWTAPDNAGKPAIENYDLRYRPGSSTIWTNGRQDVTETSAMIASLTAGTTYEVQVRATNEEGDGLWSGTGTGSTNAAPAFSGGPLSRSVEENTAADSNVGAVIPAATDADNDPLTYTMEGADADSFTFDATTRQIKTKTGVTYDHEADPSYEVTIKADDANGGTGTIAVTISVTDVKERPAAPAAPSVAATPGSTTSLDVSWAAPGNAGKPAISSYDLRYRTGAGNWADGSQGVTATPSTIASLTVGTTYEVQVRATNDEGNGPWSDSGTGSTGFEPTVVPTGWDLIPPGLDPGDNFRLLIVTSTPQVPSSTVIGAYDTVVRNDVSGNGHTAIRGYSSHFKMLGCTSTIDATVHTSTRSGDTAAPIYWLNGAKVADDYGDFYDGNWDSNAPKYPSGEDAPTSGSNSRVFHGCLSTGLRSTHSLGPTQASAQVTTGLPGVRGYELHDLPQLVGTNGRPYYGLSRIFQVPPNNAPVFTGGPLSRSIPENTTTVTDVGAAIHAATDADNDPLTYTMEGADADSFTFDATTRQIKTKTGVTYDHEADPSYEVTIKAEDSHGGTGTVAVTITVTDVEEPTLALTLDAIATDDTVNIAEQAAGFSISGDTGTEAGVTVSVTIGLTTLTATSADDNGTAAWSVAVPPGAAYIAGTSVDVTVSASKIGFTAPSDVERTLAIDLAAPAVSYTAPPSLKVGDAITAMSPGTDDTDIASYSAAGLPSGLVINASTGAISGTPDTADENDASATVTVTDTAGNPADVSITFPAVDKGDQTLTGFAYSSNSVTFGDTRPRR